MNPATVAVVAWLIPGGGHFLVGQLRKSVIFFVVLSLMFVIGLAFGGRLFPFQWNEPLVALAAAAEWVLALPRLMAAIMGQGRGDVVALHRATRSFRSAAPAARHVPRRRWSRVLRCSRHAAP